MEEEEEIQSHPSRGGSDSSGSSPSPSTGGMSSGMKPAASPPASSHPLEDSNALALAVTVHASASAGARNSSSIGRSGGGLREDCWSEDATAVLIDAWGERYLELKKGNLKQTHWKEVAEAVSSREDHTETPKTDIQCNNRIDTVKKKYKQEKARTAAGEGPSRWIFFKKLDRLIGSTAKIPNLPIVVPTRSRSNLHQHQTKPTARTRKISKRLRFKKRDASESEPEPESESEPEDSARSADSLPRPPLRKKVQTGRKKKETRRGSQWDELTRATLRFGEAYEHVESAKIQQQLELEKERMKFIKELELQRMHFFLNAQLHITKLRQKGRGNQDTLTTAVNGGKKKNN